MLVKMWKMWILIDYWCSHLENSLAAFRKVKHKTTMWSSNPTLGFTWEKLKHMSIQRLVSERLQQHYSYSPKLETVLMSIKWVGRQNVVDPYDGILFSDKKEWTTDICYFMNEPQKHYSKYPYNIQTYCMIPFI